MQPESGVEVGLFYIFTLISERDGVTETLHSKRVFLMTEAVIQPQKTQTLSQPEARDFISSGFYGERTESTLSPNFWADVE